jgi:hypothetical protein
MSTNPLEQFLSQLNDAARAAADFGAQEKLTVWVRQAMIEWPTVAGVLAWPPGQLLSWLNIFSPQIYEKYITRGCGEERAIEIVGALQARLNG